MKASFSLLIIIILSQYSKETACTSKTDPLAAKDCIEIELEEDEEKCCLLSYTVKKENNAKNVTKGNCIGLTAEQYEDINNFFKGKVEELGENILTANIDCGTNYLIISILSLFLLFL